MIDGLQPYPAYRNPGVSWLEEVPEHWEVRQLKRTFRRVVGGSTPSSTEPSYWDGDIVWITPPDVSRTERLTTSLRRLTEEGLRACSTAMVPPGSIVVTTRAPVGNVAVAEVDLCTNQGCKALVPAHDVDSEFAFYVVRMLKPELQSLATGTTFTEISTSTLGAVQFPLPSLQEQAAIARFLDHADRRIRRYVAAKKALIALLNEQKQVIIHRAVTRGLDPSVRLKPSGVEWLGDAPEHWQVGRVKVFYAEVDHRSATGSEELLSVSHLTGVTPRSEKNITMFMAESYAGHKLCREADVVVNTMWAWMGALGVARQTGIVSPAYAVYRPRRPGDFEPTFVEHLLRTKSYVAEFVRRSTGIQSSRLRLYPEQFLRIPLLRPPLAEQMAILKAIAHSTFEVERAARTAKREIELISEFRTRLIADVVTGRLDIREAAARLFDEVEPEMLGDADATAEGDESDVEGDPDSAGEETEA